MMYLFSLFLDSNSCLLLCVLKVRPNLVCNDYLPFWRLTSWLGGEHYTVDSAVKNSISYNHTTLYKIMFNQVAKTV